MSIKPQHLILIVMVISAAFTSCKSENNSLSAPANTPATPTGLMTEAGANEITLVWDANSEEDLSHYNIYQGIESGNLNKVSEVNAGTETYNATDLEGGTTYYFSINAENTDGQVSEMAGEVNAVTQEAAPVRYETAWTDQFGSSAEDGFGIFGITYGDEGTLWAVGHFGASFEGVGGSFVMRINAEDGTRLEVEGLDFPVVPIRPNAIALTSDGGYVVAGAIFGEMPGEAQTGISDAIVARFDNTGTLQWAKQVGVASQWTEAHAVAVSASGDIYITGNVSRDGALPGQTASGGGRDVFLMKYDAEGDLEWIRQFGNGTDRMWGHGVSMNGDEIIVMGTVSDEKIALPASSTGGNTFMRHYDESGENLTTVQFDVPIGDNEPAGMALDDDGAVWVFGGGFDPFEFGSEGGRDFILAKIDPANGTILAAGQLGTPQGDWGDTIALGSEGEVYVGGATEGSFPGYSNSGDYDIAIARMQLP